MDRIIKIALAVFLVVVVGGIGFLFTAPTGATETGSIVVPEIFVPPADGNVTVYFFYGEECPHCKNVEPLLANLSEKYPQVMFRSFETWHNKTNAEAFAALNKQLGVKGVPVPEVVTGNTALVGDREIPAKLEAAILDQLKKKD